MSLRQKIMSGGVYLTLRQGIGMLISLGGMLLLTRLIGPDNYGLYTAAYGVFWYFQIVSQLGIEVFLVRREQQDESLAVYHQGFTLLLGLAVLGLGAGLLSLPLLQQWVNLEGFSGVARALFLTLPLVLVAQVPLAKMERELDYRRIAVIELANQMIYYLVALVLARQGWGVWAPVAGWWVQQVQALGLMYVCARYRPRLYWELPLAKQMLSYSVGFSTSFWIWQARILVNPLLVGRFGGAEAVGFVALAIRMTEVLGFVKQVTWRLSIAALAKFQDDPKRLRRAVNEGMGLQILALGPAIVALAWVLPVLLPILFGEKWLPVLQVFPFVALGSLTNSLFNLHSSVLYVLQKNWQVAVFHLVHLGLFSGAAVVLLPRLGLVGYGWAEVAAIASYAVVHGFLTRIVGNPDYRIPGLWWAAFAGALFVYQVGWWSMAGLLAISVLPSTHRRLQGYVASLKGGNAA
jgi:O-antigen/teichoic acid export membrane protein